MDKTNMVKALELHFAKGRTNVFAQLLGVPPQRITTWKGRNTFDAEIVYAKCEGINPHWLLTGEGEMILSEVRPAASPAEKAVAALEKVVALLEADNDRLKQENEQMRSAFPAQPIPSELKKKGKTAAVLPSK